MLAYTSVKFDKICRLCATHQAVGQMNIFDDHGKKLQLQRKIEKYLSIKITENDVLPKVVCRNCLYKLEDISAFHNICILSEEMLSSYYENAQSTDAFCNTGMVYIKDTIANPQPPKNTLVQFDQAPEKSPIENTSDIRLSTQLPITTNKTHVIKNNDRLLAIDSLCKNENDSTKENYQSHSAINRYGQIKKYEIISKNDQSILRQKKNINSKILIKSISTIIPSKQSLQKSQTSIVTTSCNNKQPGDKQNIESKSLATINNLQSIMNSTFLATNENVREKIVTKKYQCSVCMKTFGTSAHLNQHNKHHIGNRPFQCDQCNTAFVRKEHLERHVLTHTGQKSFTCMVCEKSFSRKDNLLKHEKIHADNEIKMYCPICGKGFVMKHYYNIHVANHKKISKVTDYINATKSEEMIATEYEISEYTECKT